MKAKDLIKVLQTLEPESDVSFSLGRDDDYREKCAKAEIAEGECLEYLDVDVLELNYEENPMFCNIVLRQENLLYLKDAADEFDKQFYPAGKALDAK